MKKFWIFLIVALFAVGQLAFAWGGNSGWQQLKKEKKEPEKKAYVAPDPVPSSQPPEQRHVVTEVSYYVQFRSNDAGWYPLADGDGNEWLLKVHYAPEVKKIDDNSFEVFGNYKGKRAENDSTIPVIVHFTLSGEGEKWDVKTAKIHSIDGVEQ